MMDEKLSNYVGILKCADSLLNHPDIQDEDCIRISVFKNSAFIDLIKAGIPLNETEDLLSFSVGDDVFEINKEYVKGYIGEDAYGS